MRKWGAGATVFVTSHVIESGNPNIAQLCCVKTVWFWARLHTCWQVWLFGSSPVECVFFFFFSLLNVQLRPLDKVIASLWGPILWCLLKHSSQQIGLQVIFSGMSLSPSLSQMTWGLSYMVLSRANRTKMRHRLHTRVCTPQRVAELFGSSWQLERGHQHP